MTKHEASWCALRVLSLCIGFCVPVVLLGQHGPGRHQPNRAHAPAYDLRTERRFTGVVADVAPAGDTIERHAGEPDMQITLRVDTRALRIVLGPSAFLTDSNVQLHNGDSLEVIGSRVESVDTQVILAREIRRGDKVWTFRDRTGQPLWDSTQAPSQGFWTKKRIVFAIVGAKVLMVAVMLLT